MDVIKLIETAERLLECGDLGDACLAIISLLKADLTFAQRCEVEDLHRALLRAEGLRSAGVGAEIDSLRWMC